jgi:hypothetical protein
VLDGDGLLRFVYGKGRKQRTLPLHASLALAPSSTSRGALVSDDAGVDKDFLVGAGSLGAAPGRPGVAWRFSRPPGCGRRGSCRRAAPFIGHLAHGIWRTAAYAGYALDIVGEARLAVDTTFSSRVL